jgi:hypothetical protein
MTKDNYYHQNSECRDNEPPQSTTSGQGFTTAANSADCAQ